MLFRSQETQQRLTDVVAYYLTIGRGWVYNNRHLLLGEVRFLGDGIEESNQKEKVYFASLAIPVTADWRLTIQRDTIQKIIPDVDIVTPDDPFEIPTMQENPLFTPLDPAGFPEVVEKVQKETPRIGDSNRYLVDGPEGKELPLRPMKSKR